ncbi:hypothetical protein G5B47_18910 [Paenibacillus sp. 7124]|uniref:Uncharacterized protein n=1 Tax=Paenibacillus apii TaxID=1850370 RepID=A0A6M1PQ31_9BACL|nr:hypothetical protein [Paenibacillus apii]NGM84484.1 hypothetical protein [Paenibacillus apii]NJJ40399.1 hypothetical protein [Paenibacillus apii]
MATIAKRNREATQEELSLVRSYLLLTFIHKVFERDCRAIGKSGLFKMPQLYMELVSIGAKKTALMLQEVKRELESQNIIVSTIRQDQKGVEAQFKCRGIAGEMHIQWPSFRREMTLRMRAYLGLAGEFSIHAREESSNQVVCLV